MEIIRICTDVRKVSPRKEQNDMLTKAGAIICINNDDFYNTILTHNNRNNKDSLQGIRKQ